MGVNRRSAATMRAWYPSGPIIGSSNELKIYQSPTITSNQSNSSNPDPNNYKIIKAHENKGYLVLKINYPDCNNYEGNKILVFENTTLIELINQKIIDPHFFQDKSNKYISPIARFIPTENGWAMALSFVETLTKGNLHNGL